MSSLLECVRLQRAASPHRAPWHGKVVQESKVLKQFTKTSPLLTLHSTDTPLQAFLFRQKDLYFACSLLSARDPRVKQHTVVFQTGAVRFCAPLIDAEHLRFWCFWELQAIRYKSSFEESLWEPSFSRSKAAHVFQVFVSIRPTAFFSMDMTRKIIFLYHLLTI